MSKAPVSVIGLIISILVVAGSLTLIGLMLTSTLRIHWEGSEDVAGICLLLCLASAGAATLSGIGLFVERQVVSAVAVVSSLIAVVSALSSLGLVLLLVMAANPV